MWVKGRGRTFVGRMVCVCGGGGGSEIVTLIDLFSWFCVVLVIAKRFVIPK